MADTRPRPRPRPRPVQKTASLSSNVNFGAEAATPSSQGTSSASAHTNATVVPLSNPNAAAKRVIVVQDTDEMFMRNRNRSSRTWQKLEKMDKEAEKQTKENSSGSDDDDGDEVLTPRRRYKRHKKEDSVVPAWQNSKNIARILSQEIASSSDDDVIEINEASTPSGKQQGKRKRVRSRSRSITPPPALPAHQILNAKRIVRQTLEGVVRPASPTVLDLDDSSSDDNLQPEFMELAKRIREESKIEGKRLRPATAGTGTGGELLLTVKWRPHPLAQNGREEVWQYKIDKTDTFRDLFEAVADDAQVHSSANIILTYQGKRFFPSVTPQTLKIWSDTAEFDAYEKKAYEYIQAHQPKSLFLEPNSQPANAIPTFGTSNEPIDIGSDEDVYHASGTSFAASTPPLQSQTQESDAESEVELGEKMKLVLRSSLTNDITLIVRSTTKCGSIVKAFLKKAGLAGGYPELFESDGPGASKGKGKKGSKNGGATKSGKEPRLSIDGDKLDNDTSIGETDLEDGDMVEVVGL